MKGAAVTGGLERILKGVGRRVRTRLRPSAPTEGVDVELVMDGVDLLNWRSPDERVRALRLSPRGTTGAPVDSPRRAAPGPPHGSLRLEVLAHSEYVVTALRDNRSRRVASQRPTGSAGTRNTAAGPDGSVWDLLEEAECGTLLRRRSAAAAACGIRELRAMHGMVTVSAGPVGPDARLQMERRRTGELREVAAMSRDSSGIARFRLGADQWAEAVRCSDQEGREDSVWNLHLVDPAVPDHRERLRWTGSQIASPRDVLRYRATASLMVPGRKVEIRPYWTRDQFVALEVKVAASIEGEHA